MDNFPLVLESKGHPVITVAYVLRKIVPSPIIGVSKWCDAKVFAKL